MFRAMFKFKLFAAFLFALSTFVHCATARHPASSPKSTHGVKAWIQGTSTNKSTSEGPSKIYFKEDSSSEIVLRDLKDIAVYCEAEFPVEIHFDGYGDDRISATGEESSSDTFQNETHTIEIVKHSTFALIFRRTGQYTCRGKSSENKNKSVSAYIYVPNQQLFIPSKTALISSTEDDHLEIPCPISEPNATVSLIKLQGGDTLIPVTSQFKYNPRKGFTHSSELKENLVGTYYCIASYLTLHKALEFEVIEGAVECTRKCGPNSKCEIHSKQEICQCKSGYDMTMVSEKCLRECKNDDDCPKTMNCVPQDKSSFLHDILNIGDGRMGMGMMEELRKFSRQHENGHGHQHHRGEDDDNGGNEKRGECKNPCVHTPACSFRGKDGAPGEQCQVIDHKATCFSTGGLSMD